MTRTKYLLAQLLRAFGIAPMEKYRTNAATENHLLRDAEVMVGQLVWDQMEGVEDISAEYWELRKLAKAQSEYTVKIEQLEEMLDKAQEERSLALEEVAEATKDKVDERDKVSDSIDRLHQEREDIQKDGRSIKRAHAGLKTKLEVLLEETGGTVTPEVSETREALSFKRVQFEQVKERSGAIDKRISELQTRLKELTDIITAENDAIRKKAEEQFSTIGKTNIELGALNSKVGVIESSSGELFAEIGRFIIANSKDPEIREAAKKYRGLLSLIDAIIASSNRHRKLVGN